MASILLVAKWMAAKFAEKWAENEDNIDLGKKIVMEYEYLVYVKEKNRNISIWIFSLCKRDGDEIMVDIFSLLSVKVN